MFLYTTGLFSVLIFFFLFTHAEMQTKSAPILLIARQHVLCVKMDLLWSKYLSPLTLSSSFPPPCKRSLFRDM